MSRGSSADFGVTGVRRSMTSWPDSGRFHSLHFTQKYPKNINSSLFLAPSRCSRPGRLDGGRRGSCGRCAPAANHAGSRVTFCAGRRKSALCRRAKCRGVPRRGRRIVGHAAWRHADDECVFLSVPCSTMSTNFFESVREKKPAELAEEYAREKARSTQLRAALTQLEHLERIELGAEPPKDVLPLPKPGDRPYSQARACAARTQPRKRFFACGAHRLARSCVCPPRLAGGLRQSVGQRQPLHRPVQADPDRRLLLVVSPGGRRCARAMQARRC